ncbi:hypothetical protein SMACR_05089 [Sordaria macrospora]|uniref:WGS project CABT00000000 data, contig 2.22 n=2 Tax=Sordaria macrospora TaxID=5147 RepID=F7W2M6_SORMK|nr:uncharacterized protein SMAC_05089 [Sordaria macrospora k-hell]KAA8633516.1 hypothetical protein SMACR_05089 [Sordaria macrospora]KAH7632535.1 hypothetical protein B0T09DRAFT_380066 [Sordaria sp. MPI-SDFR-AT-0083]WPJ60978.1 hypothetical protein SMAC4_05089 [Sordaria macrospora]CCC11877.1 unnamed protein product [Sordaria macrospora k-hell]
MCFQIIRSFSCGCARHHKLECCVSKALRLSSSTTGVAPLSPGEGCDWTISGPRRFRFSTPCQTCAYAQCIWLTGNFSISSKGSAWTGLMKNGAAAERVVGFRWLRETRAKLKRTLQERDREEKDGEDFEWRTEHWRRMLQRKRIRREVRNRWREKRRGREERGL